jgi:hypothetical protein
VKTIKIQIKLFFIVGITLVCRLHLNQVNAQSSNPVPVVFDVPFAPIPVKAMDKVNLVYELHITNFSGANLVLTGVEVLADDPSATSLASYRDAELNKRLGLINPNPDSKEKNVIGGGKRAMVFLMISTDASNAPTALRHRLFFKPTAADSSDKVHLYAGDGQPATACPMIRVIATR